MRRYWLYKKTLLYHWRVNVPVVLGAAVATAALTGALVVGDSMRASLTELALSRLGRVDYALVAQRFFGMELVESLRGDAQFKTTFAEAVPTILMNSAVVHAELRSRAGDVNLIGMDDRFWSLSTSDVARPPDLGSREVMINEALAHALRATSGDDVLIRTAKPSAISTETLLGRRDDTTSMLRLKVREIIPTDGLGGFTINPRQSAPMNAFVPLSTLQRAIDQSKKVNAIFVVSNGNSVVSEGETAADLERQFQRSVTLGDFGLELSAHAEHDYVALESQSILIPTHVEIAAMSVSKELGLSASAILTHLANAITLVPKPGDGEAAGQDPSLPRQIPYSTVAAIDPASFTADRLRGVLSKGSAELESGQILLNQWAADDLDAEPGDSISLSYYVSGPMGRLDTRAATFTLAGVLRMEGSAVDPAFIPEYPGVTDTQNLADWDPPFPVDLSKVRRTDEDYWDDYRTTPKAFVSLADGKRLWAEQGDRFGRLTSIRFSGDILPRREMTSANLTDSDGDPQALLGRIEARLLARIQPTAMGLTFEPVRANAASAARGSTDFGMLFIGFSFFLIAAAAMLVALLFRLNVERRSNEAGILLATGFPSASVGRQFVIEGALLSVFGGLLGLIGAVGYAWLMLVGLGSWWSAAVNAPRLTLLVTWQSLAIGFAVSVVIATTSVAWAVRGLVRQSVRALLSGAIEPQAGLARQQGREPGSAGGVGLTGKSPRRIRRRRSGLIATILLVLAGVVVIGSLSIGMPPPVAGFFVSGSLTLASCIAWIAYWLGGASASSINRAGPAAIFQLAIRNAPRHPGRSMTIAALIASATFVIASLEAFRIDARPAVSDRTSGTGGFALYAESAVPLPYDLNTPSGREALGIDLDNSDQVEFSALAFRLRPGDATSCTNLYVPVEPRIVGASQEFIERGGFRIAGALEVAGDSQNAPPHDSEGRDANPWALLNADLGPDVIPAIGDEAAVLWQLHLGLGQELTLMRENGRPATLRFVALLKGSVLQDEIIIAEGNFERLFPSIAGHAFFLVEVTKGDPQAVELALERDLEAFGFDAASTNDRLAAYNAVQNTYLSTFQSLGGFGLLLGTLGLSAVLLRNVLERRREFALLRAVGYAPSAIGSLVLVENMVLVLFGLAAGSISAAVAILPRLLEDPAEVPWGSVGLLLLLVLLAGLAAGTVGFRAAVRAPLVASLRSE